MECSDQLHESWMKIQALIQGICNKDCAESKLDESVEKIDQLLKYNQTTGGSSGLELPGSQSQVKEWAVSLWNLAVARRLGKALPPSTNAKLRQTACDFVFLCHNMGDNVEDHVLRKQITMNVKTARAWLDAGEPEKASYPLNQATQFIVQLEGEDGEKKGHHEATVSEDHFKLLCYKAEAKMTTGNVDNAISLIEEARQLLEKLPQQVAFLCMLCYNFGVDCFESHQYESSTVWLQQSFELGKTSSGEVSPEMQARTLRLLANAYLEWDVDLNCQKALNSVSLANAEHCHPTGLYLKTRILLHGKVEDVRLKAGIEELIRHPELTPQHGLQTMKLLMEHNRTQVVLEVIHALTHRFENTPASNKLLVAQLDYLLQCHQLIDAKQLMEKIITDHKTGKPFEQELLNSMHLLLWDCASNMCESKNYMESLQWYNYSWSLFPSTDLRDKSLAKLHRNRAACYIALEQIEKAEEAAKLAEGCDPVSPHTFYLQFKIALAKQDNEAAVTYLEKIGGCTSLDRCMGQRDGDGLQQTDANNVQAIICLAAQTALEQSNREVTITALEQLVQRSTNTQQVLTALRCLCRLRMTSNSADGSPSNPAVLVGYINTAFKHLAKTFDNQHQIPVQTHDEASWFMKIAWNLALQCSDACREVHQCFKLCCGLSRLLPQDAACFVRQKTCLLMAAAASLQVAKTTVDQGQKRVVLEETLEHVRECHQVMKLIQASRLQEQDPDSVDSTSLVLLVLYEFEARINLNDGAAEKVLEDAIAIPQCEAKAFETLAALAMEGNGEHRAISVRALKVAIKKRLQLKQPDFVKCSQAFHSLVELAMQGGCQPDQSARQEAWGYCMDASDVVENKAKGEYPEQEILWLMTRVWNCGIHLYSGGNNTDAIRWCELAMKLLGHMPNLKTNYITHMSSVYGDILAKVDTHRPDNTLSI